MNVRTYKRGEDYPIVEAWNKAAGRVMVHESQLPPLGYIAEHDGKPIACLFAFQSVGCGVAFVERFISAPDVGAITKLRAGLALWDVITDALKRMDYGLVYSNFCDPRLARIASRHCGFVDMGEATQAAKLI